MDRAEIRTTVLEVEDTAFPEPIVVGKHDIYSTGLTSQRNADEIVGLDEDSTILAPFVSKKGH